MCGEKYEFVTEANLAQGSPPRVRGKERPRHPENANPGITPACAGKSRQMKGALLFVRDHPRVCGEKGLDGLFKLRVRGSPPRVRGKGQIHQRIDHGLGITPACAGKSQILMDTAELEVDHPRVCGEKTKKIVVP